MIVSDDIFVMLLTEAKFKTFTPKETCDATKSTEVLICLSRESRSKVDEMVRKAIDAGGTTYSEKKDHGFMLQHGFQDLDGHLRLDVHGTKRNKPGLIESRTPSKLLRCPLDISWTRKNRCAIEKRSKT